MSNKQLLISQQEDQFAKMLALQMRANTPQPHWHVLIPFKFLYEFLTIKKDKRWLNDNFFYTKNLALDIASKISNGSDKNSRLEEAGDKINNWLNSKQLNSEKMHELQMHILEFFVEHYIKLLSAEGRKYEALVRDAYEAQPHYESFLNKITDIEEQVDLELLTLAETLVTNITAFQQQVEVKQEIIKNLRNREAQDVFK